MPKSKSTKSASSTQNNESTKKSAQQVCAPDFMAMCPANFKDAAESFMQPFSTFQREANNFFANAMKSFSCDSPFSALSACGIPSFPDFQSAFRSFGFPFPGVDLSEDDSCFTIAARVPESCPENVDVSVSDNCVTISCNSENSSTKKDAGRTSRTVCAQSFYRTIALPEVANASKAEADFKNGLLTITVPKRKDAIEKSRRIPIGKKSA